MQKSVRHEIQGSGVLWIARSKLAQQLYQEGPTETVPVFKKMIIIKNKNKKHLHEWKGNRSILNRMFTISLSSTALPYLLPQLPNHTGRGNECQKGHQQFSKKGGNC